MAEDPWPVSSQLASLVASWSEEPPGPESVDMQISLVWVQGRKLERLNADKGAPAFFMCKVKGSVFHPSL